ncbi:MAG: histidine kinase [Acidobacteriota bacterium]
MKVTCWDWQNLPYSLLLVLGTIIFGCSFSIPIYFVYVSTGNPITWAKALSVGLIPWATWCFLFSLTFWLVRRFPIEAQRWWQGAIVYLLISIVVVLFKLGLDIVLISQGEIFKHIPVQSLFAIIAYFNFLTYWGVIGVCHALCYYQKMRERELRASQLAGQLAQAQLQALKMQLQPHFLFNTLHTITMLNLKDSKAANRMLIRLSDLLRLTLENTGVQEVSLRQELDFLQQYLEIEQTRFQDRLSVRMDVDPKALDARVPNLILQPIVENALRHGLAQQETDGLIEINIARQNGWLQLRVHDNGLGISEDALEKINLGIGLRNTQERLEQLYGVEHRFEMKNANSGGLEVTITIPFHERESGNNIKEGNGQ